MQDYIYEYSAEKALESTKLITKRLGFLDSYTLGHLLFIAEMVHIQEYGRPVFGDRYIAIAEGAICSGIFSLCLDAQRGKVLEFICANSGIKSIQEANLEVLSESDINALNWTCDFYLSNENWKELCRTDEWKVVFEASLENNVIKFKLLNFKNCVLFLKDGEDIWNHMCG